MFLQENKIRAIVRSILREDLEGFKQKTKKTHYAGDLEDPTFEKNPTQRKLARSVKQAFSEESDQNFFKEIKKIHWVRLVEPNAVKNISWVLDGQGKNEISTIGYAKDASHLEGFWGDVGIEVQGRVTLAHNDMDEMYTGYAGSLDPAVAAKYSSSGIPKRSSIFTPLQSMGYILDEDSFEGGDSNEMIVGNWKPVAIWLSEKGFKGLQDYVLMYQKNPSDKMWGDRVATQASSTSLRKWGQDFIKISSRIVESGLPIFLTNRSQISTKDVIDLSQQLKKINGLSERKIISKKKNSQVQNQAYEPATVSNLYLDRKGNPNEWEPKFLKRISNFLLNMDLIQK